MPTDIAARKFAVIIAVEHYLTGLSSVTFAGADAAAFAEALKALGFENDDIHLLVNEQATGSLIHSKLRRVAEALQPGDTLFVYYAGHGFAEAGHNYITCYDTDRADIVRTSVSMKVVLDYLADTNGSQVACFIDACHSGIRPTLPVESRGLLHDLSAEELMKFFSNAEFLVCFSSCKEGQKSFPSNTLGHGVWTHCLLEALEGRAPNAIERDGLVTAKSLQVYLSKEVPAVMRKVFSDGRTQTPMMFGESSTGDFLVANVGPVIDRRREEQAAAAAAEAVATASSPIQIRRATLASEESSRVKALSGFRSTHKVPKDVAGYAEAFIQGVGAEDLGQRLDALVARMKKAFGFKRAEITTSVEKGFASVMTPKFNASLSLKQDGEDPGLVTWRLEVDSVDDPATIQQDAFDEVFGDFEEMDLQFRTPLDVAKVIDAVEAMNSGEVTVRYPTSADECTVSIRSTGLRIKVTRSVVTFHPAARASARELALSAETAVGTLTAAQVPLLGP